MPDPRALVEELRVAALEAGEPQHGLMLDAARELETALDVIAGLGPSPDRRPIERELMVPLGARVRVGPVTLGPCASLGLLVGAARRWWSIAHAAQQRATDGAGHRKALLEAARRCEQTNDALEALLRVRGREAERELAFAASHAAFDRFRALATPDALIAALEAAEAEPRMRAAGWRR